jgi:hypothetical protein
MSMRQYGRTFFVVLRRAKECSRHLLHTVLIKTSYYTFFLFTILFSGLSLVGFRIGLSHVPHTIFDGTWKRSKFCKKTKTQGELVFKAVSCMHAFLC